MEQKFDVTGMTCAACSAAVNKSVAKVDGVKEVNVNLLTNSMVVTYEETKANTEKIVKAVENAGYHAAAKTSKTFNKADTKSKEALADPQKEMKKRIIISAVFLIPLMTLAMFPMIHHLAGFTMPAFLMSAFYSDAGSMNLALTEFLFVIPIIAVNRKYYQTGFKTLIHRSPNMDSLIALGSSAAILYSVTAMYRIGIALGQGNLMAAARFTDELYFESAGTILTLITLGKFFEARAKGKTTDAIKKLIDLAPKTATVLRNKTEKKIPVEAVVVGDILIIRSGEAVPVDGRILEGNAAMDESALTGESIPVDKTVGDKVITASINRSGYIKITAEKIGEDTALAKIIELVEEASSSKAPIAKLADRISGIFVPVVIAISILSMAVWLIAGASFSFALSIGIAILVIACPCALGLATPVAIMVGTGRGAANGILIKSAESFETLHAVKTIVLDKTGTITEGKPAVTGIYPAKGIDSYELLRFAAAIEKLSGHPLGEAIVRKAEEESIHLSTSNQFELIPGQGIKAVFEGEAAFGGNMKMMKEQHIEIMDCGKSEEQLSMEGKTVLHFARKGEYLGMIAVADKVKPTSKAAIAAMKHLGLEVVMLTGDNQRTAEAIQKQLSIDTVIAQVLPEDKEREIRRLQAEGKKVAMVGDGINDAPALMRADTGIAIGAGTDIAIDAADIVLMKSDLFDVVTAIELSRATLRNIKQNLFWAFFYNTIGIPLAAGVLYTLLGIKLNPMIGAAAMGMSSVSVVANALRLRFFRPRTGIPETMDVLTSNQDKEQKLRNIEERSKEDKIRSKEIIESSMEEKDSSKEVSDSSKGENTSSNKESKSSSNTITIKGDYERMKKEIIIEGMMCEHCKGRVEKALQTIPGVTAAVDLEAKKAYVSSEAEVADETFTQAVTDAGYEVMGIQSV